MSWKDDLPEEMRGTELVQNAETVESVVKQAIDFQSMLGNSIRLPGEGASDEAVAEFRTKAERFGLVSKEDALDWLKPDAAEKYAIDSPPEDAETIGLTQGEVDKWKSWAFDAGLSPEQFNAYATRSIEAMRESHNARQQRFSDADAALKETWGEEAYDARKSMALAALKKYGGDELVERMGAEPDPEILMAFAEVGKIFAEKGLGDVTPTPTFAETRDEAQLKLNEIRANEDHPFNKGPMGPGGKAAYDAAAKEVMRLQAIAMGKKPGEDIMFAPAKAG